MTLLYLPQGGLTALPPTHKPKTPFVVKTAEVWDTEDGWALVLRPELSEELDGFQREFATRAMEAGLEVSPYHQPDAFKPHITLAYYDDPVTVPTFESFALSPREDVQIRSGETVVADLDHNIAQAVWEQLVAEGVLSEDEIVEGLSGFKSLQDNRWMGWYTNAYRDREGEYFPTLAIKNDIERMWRTKQYPELWFYHMLGTRHGQADAVIGVGRFAIAVGHYDDTPIAAKFRQYYAEHPRRLSHGFQYSAKMHIDGAFWHFNTYEISTLPPRRESNPYTLFE